MPVRLLRQVTERGVCVAGSMDALSLADRCQIARASSLTPRDPQRGPGGDAEAVVAAAQILHEGVSGDSRSVVGRLPWVLTPRYRVEHRGLTPWGRRGGSSRRRTEG